MTTADAPIKALFVEDDERLARLTVRYLEGSGFLVSWVATGPEAVVLATHWQFDVVLLDLVTKPFSSRELVSRIRAVVRRARGLVGPPLKPIEAGVITVDPASMRVTVSGREVPLTGYEFALLKVLAERAGRVLSREQLLDLADDRDRQQGWRGNDRPPRASSGPLSHGDVDSAGQSE